MPADTPALAGAAITLPAALELREILQATADEAVGLLGLDASTILLIDPDSDHARWVCDAGVVGEDLRGGLRRWTVAVGCGPIGTAVASGATAVVTGESLRAEFSSCGHALAAMQPESGVFAPMRGSDGSPLGILCGLNRSVRTFQSGDLAVVACLAADAGRAIELRRVIDRLAEAAAHYRFLLDRLPDGVWAADANRIFTYLSAGCERLLGYRPDELVGRSSEIVMHESSREAFAEGYRWQLAHPDGEQTYRVNLRHKDGHAVPVELHNIGTSVNGKYGGGQGSVREMTERDRLEREIRAQAAELASSRERAHLAQELHDSVTQALFSMTITAGAARILLERNAAGVDEKLAEVSSLARDALAEMRSLIFELRPGSLAEQGFVPALRSHLTAVQGRTGLAIRLYIDPDLPRLDLADEDALYRIAQEAVHNVVKHAAAHEVVIRIAARDGRCRMEVQDDGIGFDPSTRRSGLGLAGMIARAERLGGAVTFDSSPSRGTLVTVALPLPPDGSNDRTVS